LDRFTWWGGHDSLGTLLDVQNFARLTLSPLWRAGTAWQAPLHLATETIAQSSLIAETLDIAFKAQGAFWTGTDPAARKRFLTGCDLLLREGDITVIVQVKDLGRYGVTARVAAAEARFNPDFHMKSLPSILLNDKGQEAEA
jgi:hypothetical protein